MTLTRLLQFLRAMRLVHRRRGRSAISRHRHPGGAAVADHGGHHGLPHATAWPPTRLRVAELLWGEGHLAPGCAAEVLRRAAPMRLAPGMTCLLVGGGLPGAAHALAGTGARITALEHDPALATHAAAWNPARPDFGAARYDRALVLEPLAAVDGRAAQEAILAALAAAIVPVGQIVLTEWVADGLDPAELAAWERLEHRSPPLAAPDPVTRALCRAGFAVAPPADIGPQHAALARDAWNLAMAGLPRTPLPEAEADALLAEEERWHARLGLIASGRLRLLCWHGMGKAHLPHVRAIPAAAAA